MSAGLDTIALAVAHLERQESAEAAKAASSPQGAEKEVSAEKDNRSNGETVAVAAAAAAAVGSDTSPRASPSVAPQMPIHYAFGNYPGSTRMVTGDGVKPQTSGAEENGARWDTAGDHPRGHHSYVYMHPPHAVHHHHHPMAYGAPPPRGSPVTVYPAHPYMMQPQQPHHPHSQGPHHGHWHPHPHYVYTTLPPNSPAQESKSAVTNTSSSPPPPPSPPKSASSDGAAPPGGGSPGSPEEHTVVFDMDELDRLLSDAIQTDIKQTPPAEVPKDESILTILTNDVLCGRGGETNHHSGNIRYRQLVKICQPAYVAAKRREKPKIAQRIVRAVRLLGGRFLKKTPEDNKWKDVGNAKAREKTSQALREGAPELRGGAAAGKEEEHPKKRKTPNKYDGATSSPPQMLSAMLLPHQHHCYVDVPPPAGVGSMYAYQPSLAQPQLAEPKEDASTHKKRRVSSESSQSPTSVARSSTPTGFAVTISADDDDGTNTEATGSTTLTTASSSGDTPRGPRLKLLKRRLQEA